MPYISHRWLGGMLTNWKTIKVPINKLLEYEENKSSGQLESMIKKEASFLIMLSSCPDDLFSSYSRSLLIGTLIVFQLVNMPPNHLCEMYGIPVF